MDCIKIIYENVNLEGYGLSKHWIGYFERKEKFNYKIMEKAVSFFIDYFDANIHEFVIVSSLYVDKNETLKNDKKVKIIKNKLVENKIIRAIKGNKYFDENQDIWEKQYNQLLNNFTEIIPTKELLKELSYIVMTDEKITGHGHCFFVSKSLKLIIYPHNDNTGYGIIGIDNKNNKYGNMFLEKAGKDKDYNTYFYKSFE